MSPFVQPAFAAGLALALAAACLAPPTYVWCSGAGETHLSCCCPRHERAAAAGALCCEARTSDGFAALRSEPRTRATPPLPCAVTAALALPVLRASQPDVIDVEHPPRAGPSDRVHARNSVYLL